jgi:hypothetical protein
MSRTRAFRRIAIFFVPLAVALFAISAMVTDELFMTAAYGAEGFRTCYHVPFLGCSSIWDVWKGAFFVMLAMILILAWMVMALSNSRNT